MGSYHELRDIYCSYEGLHQRRRSAHENSTGKNWIEVLLYESLRTLGNADEEKEIGSRAGDKKTCRYVQSTHVFCDKLHIWSCSALVALMCIWSRGYNVDHRQRLSARWIRKKPPADESSSHSPGAAGTQQKTQPARCRLTLWHPNTYRWCMSPR